MHSKSYLSNFFLILLLGGLVFIGLSSCNDEKAITSFTDSRDNQTYRTMIINNKEWMIDNLKFQTDSSWCYQNESENCDKYGRLYIWEQAMQACPHGWKVPSQDDWMIFTEYIAGEKWHEVEGGEGRLYRKLIEGGSSGFEVNFPGLYSPQFRIFKGLDDIASFWSSTKFAFEAATCAVLDKKNGEFFSINPGSRDVGHSCRCLRILN